MEIPRERTSMKSQYVGDISDYFKYGLLRALVADSMIQVGVCWMLTPDDGGSDGQQTSYLDEPGKWRSYDPPLFDMLHTIIKKPGTRHTSQVESCGILPSTMFWPDLLPDDAKSRNDYFERFFKAVEHAELVFFDPDKGLEIASAPFGRKPSTEHLYWCEVSAAYRRGHSLLIFQYIPPFKVRERYITSRLLQLQEHTGAKNVIALKTSKVAFLLAVQEAHAQVVDDGLRCIERGWGQEFSVMRPPSA
jgi:hypothetical protein